MKTAEEKAKEYLDEISGNSLGSPINAVYSGFIAGYNEAMRWQDPKEELPNLDMQVVIKGGILKNEVGQDIENDYSAGYYEDGVWYVSPTDYYSIEIENPTGWRPIE